MSTMTAEANINTDTVHSETQVQVRHLAALLLFAAKSDVRGYLNGIHMYASRDGNLILEATDGHRLMRIVTDAPHRAPVGAIMARDMAARIVKAMGRNSGALKLDMRITCHADGDGNARTAGDEYYMPPTIQVRAGGDTFISESLAGRYPDCDRVIPARGRGDAAPHVGAFNLNYLLDMHKALILIGYAGRSSLPGMYRLRGPAFTAMDAYPMSDATRIRADADASILAQAQGEANQSTCANVTRAAVRAQINSGHCGAPGVWRTADDDVAIVIMPLRETIDDAC